MKALPKNTEAEASLLGCMLLNPDLIGEISHLIDGRHFTLMHHNILYQELVDHYDNGKDIDSVVLSDALSRRQDFTEADSSDFLTGIMDTVVSSANYQSYLQIVRDKYLVRSLIDVNNNILEDCYGDYGDAEELLDRSEQLIFEIAKSRETHEGKPIGELLKEACSALNPARATDC